MSIVEKRQEFRPSSGAAPFELNEVFFSRTDKRGVISSGNYVFRRVAHYDWSKLIGAPHKIIRHPDMPRAVFRILWDTIQKGKPIGAYVKNKAEDGLHYWVFAVIVPTEDGYLSARIKPSSKLFESVQAEYAALRKRELAEALDPGESAKILISQLKKHGFADYYDFCTHAVVEELRCRDKGLGQAENSRSRTLREVLTHSEELKKQTEA